MRVSQEVLACRICRIHYDDGTDLEVPMTAALAAAIERLDEAARKREARHRQRMSTFTDMGINGDGLVNGHQSPRLLGNHWDGPRYTFDHFLGTEHPWMIARFSDVAPLVEQQVWHERIDDWCMIARPSDACDICHGEELPDETYYCLRCDHSGRDGARGMRPSRADLARRPRQVRRRLLPTGQELRGGRS
jgi:hypothetical protein